MLTDAQLEKLFETRAYDRPRTKTMRNFLKREAPHRVVGLSIEPDGVFIYTDSEQWQDDSGAGTFREDSETEAIKYFRSMVQPGVKRRKNPVKKFFQLYDVANDYSLSPVPGKYQFGDLAHAKKAAQKIIDVWVSGMKSRPVGPHVSYKIKWSRSAASGQRPEAINEWNGSIHSGELVYKIIERRKNPVKKKTRSKAKRKGNPQRITQAWLEKRVALINDMMGNPEAAYTRGADGGLKNNQGHLYIDHAYGRVGLEEMGRSGANAISGGHVPKRELNNFLDGMIAALRLLDQRKRGRNPTAEEMFTPGFKPGKKKKKKVTRTGYNIFGFNRQGEIRYVIKNNHPIVTLGLVKTRTSGNVYKTKSAAKKVVMGPGPLGYYDGWTFGVIARKDATAGLRKFVNAKLGKV